MRLLYLIAPYVVSTLVEIVELHRVDFQHVDDNVENHFLPRRHLLCCRFLKQIVSLSFECVMNEIRLNMILDVSESGSHPRCTTRSKSSCIFNLFMSYPLIFLGTNFEFSCW